jgi:hypothetical protein
MSELLHINDFSPHQHTIFHVNEPAQMDLELESAEDRSNEKLEQFSLLFTGPASNWLQQGTYKLHHAVLGEQELFLVPLGPRAEKMLYQSVFARFQK